MMYTHQLYCASRYLSRTHLWLLNTVNVGRTMQSIDINNKRQSKRHAVEIGLPSWNINEWPITRLQPSVNDVYAFRTLTHIPTFNLFRDYDFNIVSNNISLNQYANQLSYRANRLTAYENKDTRHKRSLGLYVSPTCRPISKAYCI